MNRRQLHRELDKLANEGKRYKVLLHACCAPCSSACLDYLVKYFDVTVFYSNSNIDNREEYEKRKAEEQRLIKEMCPQVGFAEGHYDPDNFHRLVKGHEKEKEGGERCAICFEMRLSETAKYAAENGFDYFGTTLTLSRQKDAIQLCGIGEAVGEKYGVKYLPSDFKKKGGDLKAIELSEKYGLYRQNYCGCSFSRAAAEKEI